MTKRETLKFIVQIIAKVATAIVTYTRCNELHERVEKKRLCHLRQVFIRILCSLGGY